MALRSINKKEETCEQRGRQLYGERKDRIVRLAEGVYRVPSASRDEYWHLVHTPRFFFEDSKVNRNCSCELVTYSSGSSARCHHMAAAEIAEKEGCREFRITEYTDAWGTRIFRLEESRAEGFENYRFAGREDWIGQKVTVAWRTLSSSTSRQQLMEEQVKLQFDVAEGRA